MAPTRQGTSPQESGTTSILLVLADESQRHRVVAYLAEEPDFQVVGSGSDLTSALADNYPPTDVDVLILAADDGWATDEGFWATLRLLLPTQKVVVLTDGNDPDVLVHALAAGSVGIHRTDAPSAVISQAARRAAAGKSDFDDELLGALRAHLVRDAWQAKDAAPLTGHPRQESRGVETPLTPREREIILLLSESMTNRQIAQSLHISTNTVAFHVGNLIRKTGAPSRLGVVIATWAASQAAELLANS
jgi:DNA-binding NarL/FixJ family response regulator